MRSPLLPGIVGVAVVAAPQIAADLARLSGRDSVTPLEVAHVLLIAGTLAAGLGALVLSRLGRFAAPLDLGSVSPGFVPPPDRAPLADGRS